MTIINIAVPLSFSHNVLKKFSNDLQIALATLSRAFKAILRNLKLVILVRRRLISSFGCLLVSLKILFILLKWFTNGHHSTLQGFQSDFEIFEISHMGANLTNINNWVHVSFSLKFFYFLKWFTNGPLNTSQGIQSNFEDSPKN